MLPREPIAADTDTTRIETPPRMPTPESLRGLAIEDVKLLRSTLAESVEYIPHVFLHSPVVEHVLLGPVPNAAESIAVGPGSSDDSGVYRLTDEEDLPLKLDREQFLFLRLNYHRCQVLQIMRCYQGRRLTAKATREVLAWIRATQETRSQIVRENIPLVLAMAKRTRITGVDPSDLISEGNLALLRAVNKFDCSRGYKFSTYACRAILKSFSRVAHRASRHRGYFPTEFDPTLERSDFVEQRRMDVEERCVDELRSLLAGEMGDLSDVERQVIRARFALENDGRNGNSGDPTKGKTLEQVGELIGVTKERVRQIQNKALGKLRTALDQSVLA